MLVLIIQMAFNAAVCLSCIFELTLVCIRYVLKQLPDTMLNALYSDLFSIGIINRPLKNPRDLSMILAVYKEAKIIYISVSLRSGQILSLFFWRKLDERQSRSLLVISC